MPIRWQDPTAFEDDVVAACSAFAKRVGDEPWQIAWCAGTGIVGSVAEELERETRALAHVLRVVSDTLCRPPHARGAFFLASSAGGVYAGVGSPPFNEQAPVAPLAPYGWSKLEQEALATSWSRETRTPLLIGRISNLYGPGQNLAKGQGLITQVCLRVLARQPLILYVPLDTIRDYLFASDAGRLVADGLARLAVEAVAPDSGSCVIKILSSQQPVTVATVLAQFRWITKRPVSVIVAQSPNTGRQARDLRMISTVWPELDRHPITTLSEGIRSVLTDLLAPSAVRRAGNAR